MEFRLNEPSPDKGRYNIDFNIDFPKVDDFLKLQDTEIEIYLLKRFVKYIELQRANPGNPFYEGELYTGIIKYFNEEIGSSYQQKDITEKVERKLEAAIHSLHSDGYIVYKGGHGGFGTIERVTDKGLLVANPSDDIYFNILNGTVFDIMHPAIKEEIKKYLINRQYSEAILYAYNEVEGRLKSNGTGAVYKNIHQLAKQSISDDNLVCLLVKAFTLYRNPQAHSNSASVTPLGAIHQVLLASLLLFEIDAIKK